MAIERTTDGGQPWRVRWYTLAGNERTRRCPDKRTASQLEAEIIRCKRLGYDWQPAETRAVPLLTDVAERYQDARRMRVAPKTLQNEGVNLDLFLRFCDVHRARTIGDLDRALLDDFLAWLMRPETGVHGKARQPQSVARVAGAALLMWQWAEDSGRFPGIPRAPRKIDMPRGIKSPVVAPTWAEMDACVAVAKGWYVRLATWLRYTGLRVGESTMLEWQHVDMATGMLTIPPEFDKNRIGRTIPLHPALLDIIAAWGKREGKLIPTKRDLHNISGGMGVTWRRSGAREAVYKGRPDHAFRRGFKSGLLALGANADAVDFLQGHKLGAGSRGSYIDGSFLPLAATIALVPYVRGTSDAKVVTLPARR
jgi:integrase